MKSFKLMSLMCFILLLFSFGCSNSTFLNKPSTQVNNELVEVKDTSGLQSIVQRVKQAIVLLSTSANVDPTSDPTKNGLCAGVAIDDKGHFLTNFHCVYKQNFIKLIYYDETDYEMYDVNVIGLDPLADLALLQVIGDVKPKSYIKISKDSSNMKEGDEVYAMGHPMGMAWTLTKGIISSNERYARHPYIKVLQTDAAINKGNSGGPLLNMKGEIVGINAMIMSRGTGSSGVGLAIRGDIVLKSLESMLAIGRVDRPAVGVTVMSLLGLKAREKILKEFPDLKPEYIPNTLGLYIKPDGNVPEPLKAHDTIIGVNGVPTNDGLNFSDELGKYEVGETIKLLILRKRALREVEVTLKALPVDTEKLYPKGPMQIRP